MDESGIGTVENALISYIERRVDSFRGYVPDQAALAENGAVVVNGRYVALLITEDNEAAREAFLNCFDENWTMPVVENIFRQPVESSEDMESENQNNEKVEEKEETASSDEKQEEETEIIDEEEEIETKGTKEEEETEIINGEEEIEKNDTKEEEETEIINEEEEMETNGTKEDEVTTEPEAMEDSYDKDAVLTAWRTGDISLLSFKNLMVYKEAVSIIEQVIKPQMSDFEKELFIHDYIIDNGQYDPEALSNAPDASPDPDNENPYGMLINGVGICRGYTSTFQLFMDMLDITCISIDGFSGVEPHAWNMVQLDGVWYCVDVTWDDTDHRHRFFNVTSQYMRETNHQWDESNVPEAVAE